MNMKRMRGRNHRGGGGGGGGGGAPVRQQGGNMPMNRNHVFDSSGPDLRIRGTSQQLFEKYLQLGRDATGSGDRVMAESYFQYAEHYFRILNAMNQAAQQNGQATQGGQQGGGQYGQNRRQDYGQNQGDQSQGDQGQGYQGQGYQGQGDMGGDSGNDGRDDGSDGDEQPVVESRPIPITAGSPE